MKRNQAYVAFYHGNQHKWRCLASSFIWINLDINAILMELTQKLGNGISILL
jgi:hypothetical protein